MPLRGLLDLVDRGLVAGRKRIDIESPEAEMIMMGAVSRGRPRPVILCVAEVIHAETGRIDLGLTARAFRQPAAFRSDIVDRPVLEEPRRGVRILRDENKALGPFRSISPFKRRREIFAIKRVFGRQTLTCFECRTSELEGHACSPPREIPPSRVVRKTRSRRACSLPLQTYVLHFRPSLI